MAKMVQDDKVNHSSTLDIESGVGDETSKRSDERFALCTRDSRRSEGERCNGAVVDPVPPNRSGADRRTGLHKAGNGALTPLSGAPSMSTRANWHACAELRSRPCIAPSGSFPSRVSDFQRSGSLPHHLLRHLNRAAPEAISSGHHVPCSGHDTRHADETWRPKFQRSTRGEHATPCRKFASEHRTPCPKFTT